MSDKRKTELAEAAANQKERMLAYHNAMKKKVVRK
jgi:hypothetical protein